MNSLNRQRKSIEIRRIQCHHIMARKGDLLLQIVNSISLKKLLNLKRKEKVVKIKLYNCD